MPETTDSVLLDFFDRTSRERREQTEAFTGALAATRDDFKGAIGELRRDFRTFGVLMLAGVLSLAGVNVAINSGALSFTRGAPATTTTTTITAPADPSGIGTFYDMPEVTAPVTTTTTATTPAEPMPTVLP